MASFDTDTFLKVLGNTGTNPFQAAGMAFGVPSCMLNLARNVLALLPSSILGDVKSMLLDGQSKALEKARESMKKTMMSSGLFGIISDAGEFLFGSDSSKDGMDQDSKQAASNLDGILGALKTGAQIYTNVQAAINEVNAILDCFDSFSAMLGFQKGNAADKRAALSDSDRQDLFNSTFAADANKLKEATDFANRCGESIALIDSILAERRDNPDLEPRLRSDSEFDAILSATNFERFDVEDPGIEDEDVFRLSYGPPITSEGSYILTSDGLYYDSQTGGLDPIFLAISGTIPVGEAWKYDYDPNLGGKGDSITLDSLNKFKDNIFDPSKIDDSIGLQHYYDEDHFLSVLKQQRDKHIYDLSGDLTNYIGDFGEDSSIVRNQRNLIISEIANHNTKINRRKKQIEVAVKAGQIYGELTGPEFPPGEIPINDFSYLEKYNLTVDLEKQRALMFRQADVEGIVLPVETKFVAAPYKSASLQYEHLTVPTVGKGSILYTPSGSPSGTVLSLSDQIENDKLFAIYNFLGTDLELPSSINFPVTNCATENMYNNAQLVAPSRQSTFFSGIAIPYLEGIVKNKSTDTAAASGLGSYLKLPDTEEFRELMYSPSGFSIECWVHVPDITDAGVSWLSGTTSSLTKVLIGSENVGHLSSVSAINTQGDYRDLDRLKNERGENFVRGVVCGFTRDRRITQVSGGYSNDNELNNPASSLSFFIAPTQARDFSSASFVNNDECEDYDTFYKMKVDLSATAFGEVSSQFVMVDITCDPKKDEIKFFADGSLVATSAISAVFGVDPRVAPSLPSFKKANSFEYTTSTVDGPTTLKQGPKLNDFYTPWIVGGGYTDGMYQHGNFLGGDRGGIISGLRGHIGSLKFYSKPLNNTEVRKNYNAQQGFFKNIKT